MDIFDRVKYLAKCKGLTIAGLEKELGFSNKSLYPHKDSSTIRGDRVVELAKYFEVTTDYLLTGDESHGVFLSDPETALINAYRKLNDEGKKKLVDYADDLIQSKKYTESDIFKVV